MSNFRERMGLIPPTAKMIAVLVAIAITILLFYATCLPPSHGEKPMPPAGKVILPILAGGLALVWVLLIGFVYGDAKQRGMRYVMWTLLAIFLPDAIGVILYFILRDPLPIPCPGCGTKVNAKFSFCPSCGAAVKPRCPQCGQPVEPAWSNCGHCGTKLPVLPPRTA